MDAQFSIKAASKRTGLTAHTIRAWERRYGVLSPLRSETGRRLFSTGDIERLSLLKQATDSGHSISAVAALSNQELLSLQRSLEPPADWPFMDRCAEAVSRLDSQALHQLFISQGNEIGVARLIEETLVPLMRLSGSRWQDGSWSVAHEHLLSAAVRLYIDEQRSRIRPNANAPRAVVCTLSEQLHEIGALLVAFVASMSGWNVAYLGANMPALDIASAARSLNADTIAVSAALPINAERAQQELLSLRNLLGSHIKIIIGGPACAALSPTLEEIGAEIIGDLAELRRLLTRRNAY